MLLALLAGCDRGANPLIPQLRPVEGGWVSSEFGMREAHPVLGTMPGRLHEGYDFAVAEGSPIRATMAGEVVYAGWRGGYGKTVVVAHREGLSTLYGHARELLVSPGDTVAAGEVLALVGSTGLSTGPHLHYELRRHDVPIDPGGFLPDGTAPLPRPWSDDVPGAGSFPGASVGGPSTGAPPEPGQLWLEAAVECDRPARTWE
ncbi:MAG: M23 family metallopeptidase [Candidatus Sericytochromatia bacterium]|nr:M23 family metallopeptidase [Candidatus Sericytochromatia bacterium]